MSAPLVPERIDPATESSGIVAYHLAKYSYAGSLASGKRVLDVACGVGYGTAFIAERSRLAVGIEIATAGIAIARGRYLKSNCHFVQANAEQLPLREGSFDIVLCFEGIEHFQDPAKHLHEVTRVMKNDGA